MIKSSGAVNVTPKTFSWSVRIVFHSVNAFNRRSDKGIVRTLPAVFVLPMTFSRPRMLPSLSNLVSTVCARRIDSTFFLSSKSFHLNASVSPGRSPAQMPTKQNGLKKRFVLMTARNCSRISSGIALYSGSSGSSFAVRRACTLILEAGF